MDIDKFKKESKVTYVYVQGSVRGTVVPNDCKHDELLLQTCMEVPYKYEDFVSFNKELQNAICMAELLKLGRCAKITYCDTERFFKEIE